MKTGLILEGGAMRGLFSAGVMDVFMENNIEFDGTVGTSAGAAFGVNYKSGQVGRALRYNKEYCNNSKYMSVSNLFRQRNLYSKDFCYHEVPEKYDIFDYLEFCKNPMEFYITCTDIVTGKAHYEKCSEIENEDLFLEWIRASCAMPVLAEIVEIKGNRYLDGGVGDSIPLKFMESEGYDRNVIILTQPDGFIKKKIKYGPIIKMMYKDYPLFVKAMYERYIHYNKALNYIKEKEEKKEIFVIRPREALNIKVSKDPKELQRVYDCGRKAGISVICGVQDFLSRSK